MIATAHRQKSTKMSLAVHTPRILCVDDDPDLHTNLELRMQIYDVKIERAFYGMQGIVEAAHTLPDLILMDHAMPNGDGEYLLQCIKSNRATANIPIIVLTGMRDPVLRNRLIAGGADVFLNKPIAFDDLVHEMSRFIDLRLREDEGGNPC
ncbi:response regulator [Aeoliella mucimassa]|uniref:Sensor histidine kinase TodS n=1 Tax=Aeoliella mucimassa TaxID=2527972 RepID=A0A518ARI5_9BACT|nr:response regulator [Aeoliella mucimassa]QDU57328.1 Sensor histidine kinase TodS [Aeoliella mucimassa]